VGELGRFAVAETGLAVPARWLRSPASDDVKPTSTPIAVLGRGRIVTVWGSRDAVIAMRNGTRRFASIGRLGTPERGEPRERRRNHRGRPDVALGANASDASGTFRNTFDPHSVRELDPGEVPHPVPQMSGISAVLVPILSPLGGSPTSRSA